MSNHSEPKKLPVSVILPCRNGGDLLGPHLDSLRAWVGCVHEVIVVDSSDDGSLERIEVALADFHPKVFSRPPGLYEAWNFGVQQARGEYIYFATVGDSALPGGVQKLVDSAIETGADIVVSPPRVVGLDGEPLDDHVWPLHRYLSQSDAAVDRLLSLTEKILACCSFLPETLIGSSASNLYRAAFLRDRAFPVDFGHIGDAAWAVSVVPDVRFVVVRDVCAQFVVHPRDDADDGLQVIENARRLMDCAAGMLGGIDDAGVRGFWLAWLEIQRGQYEKRFFQPLESAVLRGRLNEEKNQEIQDQKQRNAQVVAKRLEATELLKKSRKQIDDANLRIRTQTTHVNELRSALAALQRKNEVLSGQVDALNADVKKFRASITHLRDRVGELQGPLGLNGKVIDAAGSLRRMLRRS